MYIIVWSMFFKVSQNNNFSTLLRKEKKLVMEKSPEKLCGNFTDIFMHLILLSCLSILKRYHK